MKPRKRKIGSVDVETYPGTYRAFADNMYEAKLMREVSPIRLASFSYKEYGKSTTYTRGEWQYKNYIDFIKDLWRIFDENDVLIGQNVKRFDNKQSNTFFAQYGLPKHSPVVWVDTMLIAKANFRLPSYSLKYLLVFFGIGTKLETGGESLWFACESGDPKARRKMLIYNRNDTVQTELLAKFFIDKGYAELPFSNIYIPGKGCVRCNQDNLVSRGKQARANGWVQGYSCKECGKRNYTDVIRPYDTLQLA